MSQLMLGHSDQVPPCLFRGVLTRRVLELIFERQGMKWSLQMNVIHAQTREQNAVRDFILDDKKRRLNFLLLFTFYCIVPKSGKRMFKKHLMANISPAEVANSMG